MLQGHDYISACGSSIQRAYVNLRCIVLTTAVAGHVWAEGVRADGEIGLTRSEQISAAG